MNLGAEGRRIRALRPAKESLDPWRPVGVHLEQERLPSGSLAPSLTVFLAGSECPFTCVFCDLWQYTLDGPTPPGALPAQLSLALEEVRDQLPEARWPEASIKLYNASNFFDGRAVPEQDEGALGELLTPFRRVVVECHAKLIGPRCRDFAAFLEGRLEVAIGLETIHPRASPRLNKGATLGDFDLAMERLRQWGIASRTFILLGAPYIPANEAVSWAIQSARYAFDQGAETVALIPARSSPGELERLASLGEFSPPSLEQLEMALEGVLEAPPPAGSQVVADLWDLEILDPECSTCSSRRIRRLESMNFNGRIAEPVHCSECSSGCQGGVRGDG
ncbi:MAG: radical SAM protein [Deltaproteobacteria bacterium]|nr:radical SAM protein [Deltaproteobacteria bacterium]